MTPSSDTEALTASCGTPSASRMLSSVSGPRVSQRSFSEVLGWLADAGLSFVSSLPKIHGALAKDEDLFAARDPGRPSDRLITELEMLITGGAEGGLFVVIARKD